MQAVTASQLATDINVASKPHQQTGTPIISFSPLQKISQIFLTHALNINEKVFNSFITRSNILSRII
jgi:hypothetical protein